METPDLDFLAPQDLELLNTLDLDCPSELLSPASDHAEHASNEKCCPAAVISGSVVIQRIAPDLEHARFMKYLIALRASGIEEVRLYGRGALHDLQGADFDFTYEKDAANFVGSVQGVRLRPFDQAGLSVDFLATSTRSKQRSILSAPFEGKSNAVSGVITEPADASASTDPYLSGALPRNDYGFDRLAGCKRKREPKVIHGYPCQYHSCNQIFDRAGDRNKHRRSHALKKDRPIKCAAADCDGTFLYPKDLRRHEQRMHSAES